jgi:hypothetical protein
VPFRFAGSLKTPAAALVQCQVFVQKDSLCQNLVRLDGREATAATPNDFGKLQLDAPSLPRPDSQSLSNKKSGAKAFSHQQFIYLPGFLLFPQWRDVFSQKADP